MKTTTKKQGIIALFEQEYHILSMVESFLIDRKARGSNRGTLEFYRKKLRLFTDYCKCQVIIRVTQLTPHNIRLYLLYLEEKGHNHGGVHAAYRSLRAFLYWWEEEIEPEEWKNPIKKVRAPKLSTHPLEPISTDDVRSMLETCKVNTFHDKRDNVTLLALLDTGARAQEFLDMSLEDVDLITGAILIRRGKGQKPRFVYLGKKSRKALRNYLKQRTDTGSALWVSQKGKRLTYGGLRSLLRRRAIKAKVNVPSLHSFRRAFALNMLRAGVDIFSLQKLMGHGDLQVLRRYLAQTTDDVAEAHRIGSPVDRWGL